MQWVFSIFNFSEDGFCDQITTVVQSIQARLTQCFNVCKGWVHQFQTALLYPFNVFGQFFNFLDGYVFNTEAHLVCMYVCMCTYINEFVERLSLIHI